MITKNIFSNNLLQKIDTEADSIITNHLQELDQVSNDIKLLEEKLKKAAVPFTFIYVLSSDQTRLLREMPPELGLDNVEFVEHKDRSLIFGKNKEGNYRLSYGLYVTYCDINVHDTGNGIYERALYPGETTLEKCQPLIETKANIRIKAGRELHIFYKKIIESLKMKADQEEIVDYSPNHDRHFDFGKIDPVDFCKKKQTSWLNADDISKDDLPF